MTRVADELELLRGWWPGLEYEPQGDWVLLRDYCVPAGLWSANLVEVVFQIPALVPATPPYGFYVRPVLTLAGGGMPANYTQPSSEPPFGAGLWGKFSWAPVAWQPHADVLLGDNMVGFASSFADRLKEGS